MDYLSVLKKCVVSFLILTLLIPAVVAADSDAVSVFHRVEEGETLTEIAHRYSTSVDRLVSLNHLPDANLVREGQQLVIESGEAAYQVHLIRPGDTFWGVAREYGVTVDALIKANPTKDPDHLRVGAELVVPEGGTTAALRLMMPVNGRLSSPFGPRWGRMHEGIDLAGKIGMPVVAAAGGVIEFAGWQGSFGRLVIVMHPNGAETYYAHLSKILVEEDQQVAAGEQIGELGDSGRTTGPNLHLEVHLGGKPVNPLQFIAAASF